MKRKHRQTAVQKHWEERSHAAQHIQAMTENQGKFLEALRSHQVVVARGSAGTGKTYIAAAHAANQYLRGEIGKIIFSRPYVPMGRTTGYWPGTPEEKLGPFLAPLTEVLKDRLGLRQR